jgi:hypothetical protein
MAGSLTDTLENKVLEHLFKATTYASPATVYAALFTVAPGEAGGGTEVAGGSYARKAITFGAAASGQIKNSADVTFDIATADWGTVVAVAIFDALTGGTMLAYTTADVNKVIGTGDQYLLKATKLAITLD